MSVRWQTLVHELLPKGYVYPSNALYAESRDAMGKRRGDAVELMG